MSWAERNNDQVHAADTEPTTPQDDDRSRATLGSVASVGSDHQDKEFNVPAELVECANDDADAVVIDGKTYKSVIHWNLMTEADVQDRAKENRRNQS